MKKRFTIIMLLISIISIAQNGINYKALIKDTNGNVLASSPINIQFIIYEGATLTNNAYQESHTTNTDINGFTIVNIGEGTVISGIFDSINWGNDEHFLNVKIDTGSGFVDLGTTAFQYVPYAKHANTAANVTGLESLDEGNGLGWRLKGRNPDFHGNIGSNAIDLSYSNQSSTTNGATGTNSFAMGFLSSANGDSCTAIGEYAIASEDFSIAIGAGALASGSTSLALGSGVEATANSSTAIGYLSLASGFSSTVIGYQSEATGNYATAIGRSTQANAMHTTAIGCYNLGNGNTQVWNSYDPLFEIGNGSSSTNRSNALTVYKSGQHNINSLGTGLVIQSALSGIIISSQENNGITINSSEDNGIEINNAANTGIDINANGNGLLINADNQGARIRGDNVGVYASGGEYSQNDIPDIILGSSSSTVFSDDGIISTNPLRTGSDMFLRSYDAVVVDLDYDNNESGNFRVRNGSQEIVFDVTESGNVEVGNNLQVEGNLQIGNITLDRISNTSMDFLRTNSSIIPRQDNQHVLGAGTNRWINVWAVDGTINTSDRRSKTNIASLNYGLSEVLQLQPVSFNWKTNPNNDTKLGLIAQDLLKVIPEVVKTHEWRTDANGNKTKNELERMGVYYSDLVPVLINAIKEQQKIIKNQEKALSNSNSNYKALLSRIENLESKISN